MSGNLWMFSDMLDDEDTKKTVTYLECTIHSFDESIIAKAFGLDLSAKYGGTSQTYDQVSA